MLLLSYLASQVHDNVRQCIFVRFCRVTGFDCSVLGLSRCCSSPSDKIYHQHGSTGVAHRLRPIYDQKPPLRTTTLCFFRTFYQSATVPARTTTSLKCAPGASHLLPCLQAAAHTTAARRATRVLRILQPSRATFRPQRIHLLLSAALPLSLFLLISHTAQHGRSSCACA